MALTQWERGGDFAAPSTLHEPNLGLVMFYSRLRRLGMGLQASVKKTTMRGAGESLCGTPMVSTNINGSAAFCRPPMPHTLRSPTGGVESRHCAIFFDGAGTRLRYRHTGAIAP